MCLSWKTQPSLFPPNIHNCTCVRNAYLMLIAMDQKGKAPMVPTVTPVSPQGEDTIPPIPCDYRLASLMTSLLVETAQGYAEVSCKPSRCQFRTRS